MNKIKSLLVLGAMLFSGTMWADHVTYQITSERGTFFAYNNKLYATNHTATAGEKNDDNSRWLIFNKEGDYTGAGQYYFYNVGTQQFWSSNNGTFINLSAEAPTAYYTWANGRGNSTYPWSIGTGASKSAGSILNFSDWGTGSDTGARLAGGADYDPGNLMAITEAESVSDEVFNAAYALAYPLNPLTFTTTISEGATYAIVNVQESGHNWYLKNAEGNLTSADASACTGDTEWEDAALFVAEKQADGVFAFKNVDNDLYLAWKGTGSRADNTGANGNKGFVDEVNTYSTWTMHNGTRFDDTFWFVAKRNNGSDGSLILKGENGAWDAWGNTENVSTNSPYAAAFSNNYGFVLVKEAPVVSAKKFYMLKNGAYGQTKSGLTGSGVCGYMEAATVKANERTFAFNGLGADGVAFSRVFQFEPEGDNFYLKAQGSYMNKLVDGSIGCTENKAEAALFNITATTNDGYYYLIDTKQSNNTCKYAQLSDWWGFGIGGWNPSNADNAARCQWAFEAVESVDVALTTVGEASYATLYAPYAVSLDSNVKAYTATVSGEYLVATEVEGVVPAFSAVILVSESAAEKAIATLVNSNAAALTSDLQGVCRATAANGELVLGDNEGIGFYTFTGTTLGANKAYCAPAAGESNLRLSFGELTSILSAVKENGGQAIFDLQGRRVVSAKGITIQNGKKVIK